MAEKQDGFVIETHRLTKIYQNRQIALNDVTLEMPAGCVLGLLGPNGAGKTTLLRLILGLHRPTAGWVKAFGEKMTPNSAHLRCRIGYIPTNPQFPRGMTPITYLDHMARLFGMPRDVRKPRLASLIRSVGLLPVSGEIIDGFSNGMTARLAVAASLINEPEVLIWDEPTHGLDPEGRRSMLELIKALAEKKSLVVSSHNLADVDEVCNHVAIMSRGHLIFQGTLQDLKGRMRKNHFELDLEGDGKAIKAAAQAIAGLGEVTKCSVRQKRMEVVLNDDPVNTTALANIFVTLSDSKVGVISIRTVGHQTEQAFLDLIGREQATGFAGAFQPDAA